MKKKFNRRSFIINSGLVSTGAFFAGSILPHKVFGASKKSKPSLSVVSGEEYFNNTLKSVELLGGMKRFVKKRSRVGLLINSDFEIFATYTSPDVSIAVVKMCFDAGASEVVTLQNVKPEYWERSKHYEEHKHLVDKLVNMEVNQFPSEFDEDHFVNLEVPGFHLKKQK